MRFFRKFCFLPVIVYYGKHNWRKIMGIIVNKETEKRTELSDRVATSLRERSEQTSGKAETDYVKGSEYGKNLRKCLHGCSLCCTKNQSYAKRKN